MLNKAYIDLRTLTKNAINIKKQMPKGVKFCAVVKADGYGHGAVEVANAIYNIADCFAVALFEEAYALRLGGIKKDIILLIPPCEEEIERALRENLTLSADSLSKVIEIEKACVKIGVKAKIHLKVNTGMNRLGVDVAELKRIFEYAKDKNHLNIEGIFSHLSAPEDEKLLSTAVDKFLLAKNIAKGYNDKVVAHLSASGGFLKGVYFDMVRIGILLYGYKPFNSDKIRVKPILTVTAPLLKRRDIKANESFLYGAKLTAKEQTAHLVRVGYADGFLRKKDKSLCANRCMDISAYNRVKLKNGQVTLIGDADILADEQGTISYEILTKATIRTEKIYLR